MFKAYDENGKEHNYKHLVDQKEAIKRCNYTLLPSGVKSTPENQPANKKEKAAVTKLAKAKDIDIKKFCEFLQIENIDHLTKAGFSKAEDFFNQEQE